MNNDNEMILRELLSASIAHEEMTALLKDNRGRGIKGGIEKEKLRMIAGDARVRLFRAQNAALAILNKRSAE